MNSNTHFLLELTLFEGAAVAWAAWEFWSARPDRKAKPPERSGDSPESPGHPEGEHRAHDR